MIGGTIKALREKRGMTQIGLTKRAELSQPYVTMLEAGERENPSLAVLTRLARALGVPVGKLLQ